MSDQERRLHETPPVEDLRLPVEREVAAALRRDPVVRSLLGDAAGLDPKRTRRELLATSLLLTEAMAPRAHEIARDAADLLRIASRIEIYQATSSDEAGVNAAVLYGSEDPVLLQVRGRMLTNLDDGGIRIVLGHELGHYLAHGRRWPAFDVSYAAREILFRDIDPRRLRLASRLAMAMEVTADRFGMLVAQDIEAFLRVEMVHASGLPASQIDWSPRAYLDQARELMEQTLADGEAAIGGSHPEHSLRAYAAWLWSESDLYRELTGHGPGTRPISEVSSTVARLLSPPPSQAPEAAAPRRSAPGPGGFPGPAPGPGGLPGGRRVVRSTVTAPWEDTRDELGSVVGGVGKAVGRASKAIAPGLEKLKQATASGVARVLDRRPGGGRRPAEPRELEGPDPLAEDDEDLERRFAELERRERQTSGAARAGGGARAARDPLAEDDEDLERRFAELERRLKREP